MPDRRWVELDVERPETLAPSMDGCDALAYLVHQIGGGAGYAEREARAALAIRCAAKDVGLERIAYLGGLAPEGACSNHLRSRLVTGAVLREGEVPVIELRAGMIVGSGSASWTIVRDLAARLPAMLLPRWLGNRSSSVSIDDVVHALTWTLLRASAHAGWYDVPGAEVMSHRELITRVAAIMGKHPAVVGVPVVTPALSSYWIAMVTRTNLGLARELVQGLQSDLVPCGPSIWDQMGAAGPLTLDVAARNALADEREQGPVGAAAVARMRAIGEAFHSGARP